MIVVFAGPTISATAVVDRCPDAQPRPPAACGDVLAALHDRPTAVVLIDGVFERVPAVWHKEILHALDRGVPVIGAASMGALRAAELHPFGMVGVGEIFESYRRGDLTDDDEVAVAHAGAEHDYLASSTALVDIRATLADAVRAGRLTSAVADRAAGVAKDLFYAERSFPAVVDALRGVGLDAEADAVRAATAQPVPQKRLDAHTALDVANRLVANGTPTPPGTHHSVFFRQRALEVGARGADPVVAHLARLLPVADALGRLRAEAPERPDADFPSPLLDAYGIAAALATTPERLWPSYMAPVLEHFGVWDSVEPAHRTTDPTRLQAVQDPRFAMFRRIAKLWAVLDHAAARAGVDPVGDRAQVADRIAFVVDNTQVLGTTALDLHTHWAAVAAALHAAPTPAAPTPSNPPKLAAESEHAPPKLAAESEHSVATRRPTWDPPRFLQAAYRYIGEVVAPRTPALWNHLGTGDRTAPADGVADLLLDANEHLYCAPTSARRAESLRAQAVGRVLDHGCGAGRYALELAAHGHLVTAVDPSEVKAGFVRWAAAELGIDDRVDDIWAGQYDTVVSVNVLDHLSDASPLIADFATSLVPDGRLLLYAHFTDDGVHTSDPAVIDRVFGALAAGFARPRQRDLELECWVRGPDPTQLLVPTPLTDDLAGQARPIAHPELTLRRIDNPETGSPFGTSGTWVAAGPRFYLRPTTLSSTAHQVLTAADGSRSVTDLATSLASDGAPPPTIVDIVVELWRRHLLWLEIPGR